VRGAGPVRRRDLLLTPLLLAGCGRGRPGDDRTIRFGLAGPPRNLDPRLATDATSERVDRLLYQRLVEFDAHSLPVPGIARWERVAPTEYRFRLTDAAGSFTDGSRLRSGDVAATYRSILEPDSPSPHRALLSTIREIRTPDADTIVFRIGEPDPLFPAYLGVGILPAAAIAAKRAFSEEPLGSGPFETVGRPGPGRLVLRRRRDGQLLELVAVKDPNVRVMKLLRGEIHLLQNDLSPELVGYLADRAGLGGPVRVMTRAGVNYSYLGFNLADPVTGRREVREALAHAIDRRALVHYLFQDRARTAESLFPPDHWAGHPGLMPYAYDPERARSLLANSGFGPSRPLTLAFKTSSDPFRVRLATAIQAQLAESGVRLDVRSYDWGTFFGDVKAGRFQLYGLTWVGIRIPDIFRYAFRSDSVPPDGANRGRYHSAVVDDLIDRARRSPDLDDQARLYRRVQARLHEDLPYLGLWYEDQIAAVSSRLSGYALAADGNYDGLDGVSFRSSSQSQSLS
jgi:peptide/nickel transport system substrate-binding protein